MKSLIILISIFMSSFGLASDNDCAQFSGRWSLKKGSRYPGMQEITIENCKIFTRDEMGYWGSFNIDDDASIHHPYGRTDYTQTVRGSWNTDKTVLTIEVFDRVEKGYHSAFGDGIGSYRVMSWKLSDDNSDILISKVYTQKFSRETGEIEQNMDVDVYYRY